MGGCRCTYRNCTVKTDGKTHMFHYPVFEKVRCHQWLVNAHKLEFLDLKVSQLKNRVVCQHHFKDENFMNFKKDKLTFDAIPTEDGPYCDTSKYVDNSQDPSKLYPIIIDESENEYITCCEKKANFSTKYGDFLTNLDLMDIEVKDQSYNTTESKNFDTNVILPNDPHDEGIPAFKLSLLGKGEKRSLAQPILVVPPYVDYNKLSIKGVAKTDQKPNNVNNIPLNSDQKSATDNKVVTKLQNKQFKVNKQPRITIISEKKITDPVPIIGKFEPVSPNFVLNINKKKDVGTVNTIEITKSSKENIKPAVGTEKKIEIEIEPLIKEEDLSQTSSTNLIQTNVVPEKPTKVSLLKPRVPPERVEAINKKRKFNMKLRDIIETCLDKLENNVTDKITEEIIPEKKTKVEKVVQQTSRPKKSKVASTQDYTIAYLEARLKKMENTLLHKIDKNSKKISDLKDMYVNVVPDKKPSVQTRTEEEIYKKHLFQEISKYLSPNSKSLIYEELFINKFSPGQMDSPDKKKRRKYI